MPSLKERIKEWYSGKYIPPQPNDPNSPIVIFVLGRYEQHTLAKILRSLGNFWMNNWKWTIGTALAVVALIWTIIHTD